MLSSVPLVVGIIGQAGGQKDEALEPKARAPRLGPVAPHHVAPRLTAQDHAVVLRRQRSVLVDDHARRGSGAVKIAVGEHARIVLMPVSGGYRLARPPVGPPGPLAVGGGVAGVGVLHQPGCAASENLIIVIVLKDVAERVQADLIIVAEVVRVNGQARAVGFDAHRETPDIDPPVVRFESRGVLGVVGRAAGVAAAGAERPPGAVRDDVWPGVAGVKVPAPIGAGHERVQAVVVIETAEAGQEFLLSVNRRVKLAVAVHIGVYQEIW